MNELLKDPELLAMSSVHESLSPLDEGARTRVLEWVIMKLNVNPGTINKNKNASGANPAEGKKEEPHNTNFGTIEEFVDSKNPQGQKQQVLCLGYYLEFASKQRGFTVEDIVTAADEARLKNFSNP